MRERENKEPAKTELVHTREKNGIRLGEKKKINSLKIDYKAMRVLNGLKINDKI